VVLSCDVFMWDDNIPLLIIPGALHSLLLFFTLLEATYKLNAVLFQYYTYQVSEFLSERKVKSFIWYFLFKNLIMG
jgi:hypothetical protein